MRLQRQAVTASFWAAKALCTCGCEEMLDHEPMEGRPPVEVVLTRIAPRELDDDNLARSFKAVRDQVAVHLGVDDRSKLVTWRYAQEKGKPREYAVRIEVTS